MKTEQKVTSLELSKQLKEAGAKQESEACACVSGFDSGAKYVSRFDSDELLERLPGDVRLWKGYGGEYLAYIVHVSEDTKTESYTAAEALGKLYLWCLKEGYCK